MAIWSDTWDLYKENKRQIILLTMMIALPILLAYWFLSNYFSIYLTSFGLDFAAYLINSFLMLWFFSLIQIPYIYIARQGYLYEILTSGEIIRQTLIHSFQIYVLGFLYAFFVTFGLMLYVIPGLILLVLFFAFPYAVAIENTSWWQTIKRSFQFGKSVFWHLLLAIFVFGVMEWLLKMLVVIPLAFLTSQFLYLNLAVMIINILVIPPFVFYVTRIYFEWKKETS